MSVSDSVVTVKINKKRIDPNPPPTIVKGPVEAN